ncbi:MAG: DUF4421 family protein [Moraxellaceae bacterium]|nr:DUF4421 family protein [Pseudobdellovibrionaceae bacterium]
MFIFIILILIFGAPSQGFCDDQISPLFGLGQENFDFKIGDIGGPKREAKYQPNMAGVSRLALTAYGFTVGASLRGSSQELDPKYGKTDFFDVQLDYHNRKWGIDFVYQDYKGFYTQSTNQLQLFPELRFQQYSLMGRIAMEEGDFTVGALLNQADQIKKSSGKYYFVGGFRQHVMDNTISLLQQDYVGINPELENLRKMKVTSLNLGLGAGKYWVADNHIFAGALLDLIGTYGFYKYTDVKNVDDMTQKPSLSYSLKVGFGYAGETYKFGFSLSGDSTTLVTPGLSFMVPQALRTLIYLRLTF